MALTCVVRQFELRKVQKWALHKWVLEDEVQSSIDSVYAHLVSPIAAIPRESAQHVLPSTPCIELETEEDQAFIRRRWGRVRR